MDGWITIGTKLQTDKFDKQILELEKKMKKEENKSIEKKADIINLQKEIDEYNEAKKKVDEYIKKLEELQAEKDRIQQQGNYMFATPVGTVGFSNEYKDVNREIQKTNNDLIKQTGIINSQGGSIERNKAKLKKMNEEYQEINSKVNEYNQKIKSLTMQKHQAELKAIKENFNGVGSNIQNAISKVSKLALGVFGIRTAFLAVRRASSELASYNPQYSANLEYIRYALTQLIAPVLEYIVNLAKTLLAYINYIANAWFGVNLFARASAKSFNQVKRNIGGASSAAKELQKTLAGFDEMNILNSSSTGGGGGVGGAIGPDFDLSDLEAVEIPEWIKWIANNKDIVIGAIKGIAEAFLVFKVLKIAKLLSGVSGSIFEVMKSLTTFNKFLLGLGITAIIIGVVMAVESLIKWIKDPTWENFKGVLYGLEIAAAGLAATLIAIKSSNPLGWIILAIDAVALLITLLSDLIISLDDETRKTKAVQNAEENLKKAREDLKNATDDYINSVERAEEAEKKLKEAQDQTGISIDELLEKMDKENITYKDLDENERKVYKAYINNKNAQEQLKTSTENLTNAQQKEKNKLYELISTYGQTASSTENYRDKVVQAYKDGKISAKDAADAIGMSMANMTSATREEFTKNIPNAIKQGLDPSQYQNLANQFNNWWNNTMNKVQQKSTSVFSTIGSNIQRALSSANSISFGASTGGYVTKMATGGIINMPNRGVPVANAIAGEAGHEGIIPLTDQQAMAQLGAEIGRNVLVNLTNITSMNGRVISRELKTIQGEQNFAYNM